MVAPRSKLGEMPQPTRRYVSVKTPNHRDRRDAGQRGIPNKERACPSGRRDACRAIQGRTQRVRSWWARQVCRLGSWTRRSGQAASPPQREGTRLTDCPTAVLGQKAQRQPDHSPCLSRRVPMETAGEAVASAFGSAETDSARSRQADGLAIASVREVPPCLRRTDGRTGAKSSSPKGPARTARPRPQAPGRG